MNGLAITIFHSLVMSRSNGESMVWVLMFSSTATVAKSYVSIFIRMYIEPLYSTLSPIATATLFLSRKAILKPPLGPQTMLLLDFVFFIFFRFFRIGDFGSYTSNNILTLFILCNNPRTRNFCFLLKFSNLLDNLFFGSVRFNLFWSVCKVACFACHMFHLTVI